MNDGDIKIVRLQRSSQLSLLMVVLSTQTLKELLQWRISYKRIQLQNIQTNCAHMSDITFSNSLLATNPPPTCQDDPVYHLLPPQPIISRPPNRRQNGQSSSYDRGAMKYDYVDITLGNSPQFPKGLQVQRQTHSISSFNQKMGDSYENKYLVRVNPPQKQGKSPSSLKTQSRAKESISSGTREQTKLPLKESSFQRGIIQSRTYKEGSRISKNSNSNVKEQNSFQSQIKNPRQQSLYVGEEVKKKFTNKRGNIPKDSVQDPLILVDRIQQLQKHIVQIQNLNKTLGLQLQMSRERLKTSTSQNSILHDKNNQLLKAIQMYQEGEAVRRILEREVAELGKLNQLFCEQIDQQKEEIVKYEEKNEESLKLLQKLNQNITKRQEKLNKELEEQANHFNKLATEKNTIEMELSQANEKLKAVEEDEANMIQTIEKLTRQKQELNDQILRLKQINQKNTGQLQQQNQKLKSMEGQLKDKIASFEQKMGQLQKQLKSSQTHNNQLLQELNNQQQQMTKILRSYQQQTSTFSRSSQQQIHRLTKNHQQQISKLSMNLNQKKTQVEESYKQYMREQKDITVSQEQLINQLKQRIEEKNRQNQQLSYYSKQLEIKLQVMTEAKDRYQSQCKDLKQEKRLISTEKQQLKNDIKQLLDTNDKQARELQRFKLREPQLNEQITNHQKDNILLEQRNSQFIINISNKDKQILKLSEKIQKQIQKNDHLGLEINNRQKIIADLLEKLKRFQKMIIIYKQELARIKDNKEAQWQEMKTLYEQQIITLQTKIRDLLEQDSKKNSKSVKKQTHTISREVKEQRTFIQPIHISSSQQSA